MKEQFSRTALLIGENAIEKLQSSHVAVFGIGGVGACVAEALVRGGIGHMTFIDGDSINLTNINRQLIATHKTIGCMKVDVAKERAQDINPDIKVDALPIFYTDKTPFDFSIFDYVVDAIDTVTSKLLIIENCKKKNIPIISCMGAANKFDPTKFIVEDIKNTSYCPLARIMRRELKKRGIYNLKVVFSAEQAAKTTENKETSADDTEEINTPFKQKIPGSMSFVPPVAGFICAGEVIKDIIKN